MLHKYKREAADFLDTRQESLYNEHDGINPIYPHLVCRCACSAGTLQKVSYGNNAASSPQEVM